MFIVLKLVLAISLFSYTSLIAAMSEGEKIILEARKTTQSITPKEFKKLIDNEFNIPLIQLDIREFNQLRHGDIWSENRVPITRSYLEQQVEKNIPNKNVKIVIICTSGIRAVLAATTLQRMQYTNVVYLEGGISNWVAKGYELHTYFGDVKSTKPLK